MYLAHTACKIALMLCIGVVWLNGAPSRAAAQGVLIPGLKTFGGPIWWTDMVVESNWRIQKHVRTGEYRLLDPRDRKMAAGTCSMCLRELDRRRRCGEVAPMPRHVVILIHGLAGTRRIMSKLGDYLEDCGHFATIDFGYASTVGTIQDQTLGLESVLRNLRGVEEVSFVCHSQGNILVRHLLYRQQTCTNPIDVRFRRMVMISPPNHGAEIADTFGQCGLIQLAAGDVVDQFSPTRGWPQLETQLATPWFEFGILAGGRGNMGFLPRIGGDDDGLISIDTHYLRGASDFCQVGGLHQLMPRYFDTRKATLRFLQCGHF